MDEIKELKVTRIRNVNVPTRGSAESAGIDLYVPFDLTKVDMAKTFEVTRIHANCDYDLNTGYVKQIIIAPGEDVLIPTGIKANIPKGYVMKIENRSSIAAIKSLVVGACVVDSDFQGEVFVNLHNVSGKKVAILQRGDKMAQAVLYPCATPAVVEVETVAELYKGRDSERGEGALGSTDHEG